MSTMGGMYYFLTGIQLATMVLQPILYLAGIITLIFAMRALYVYSKNNKPPKMTKTAVDNQLQGSVFGSTATEEETPAKEETSKAESVEEKKEEAAKSADAKTE